MSKRIDILPIVCDHWRILTHTRKHGKQGFVLSEVITFGVLPALFGFTLGYVFGFDESFLDFTTKLALLFMPLMLNLLFTLYRAMQDEQKTADATTDILKAELATNKDADPSKLQRHIDDSEKKRLVFEELCSHVLYVSVTCLVLAVLCGAAIVTRRSGVSQFIHEWHSHTAVIMKMITLMVIYGLVFHTLLTATMVMRKMYSVMTFNAIR